MATTTLLDVGTTQEPNIRLCITAEASIEGHFMTLSHRWGSVPLVRLTVENCKVTRSNINSEGLPQLFKDAAMVARGLKTRYLSINSLCILQDHVRDFSGKWSA